FLRTTTFLPLRHVYYLYYLCYVLSLYPFTERYTQPYFFSCLIRQRGVTILVPEPGYETVGSKDLSCENWMVNTRTDTDLFAAVQNALQTLLPQIREEIREEFRTGSGSSNAGNNKDVIQDIKKYLNDKFSMKDLGPLHYYLDTKPSSISLDPTLKLTMNRGEPISDPFIYRTLVGKLLYLTITRHNLSFSAQALSQFLQEPTTLHMKALLKVIRYVKLTLSQVTDYGVFLGSSLISWQSKMQNVVSRLSTEVECRALADTTCEIFWLKCLLQEFKVQAHTPVLILCDNISSIALASNPIQHARTKHTEIDYHFVRDKVRQAFWCRVHGVVFMVLGFGVGFLVSGFMFLMLGC
nr:hypothetical protein [Tanacetum cinerariifolium]